MGVNHITFLFKKSISQRCPTCGPCEHHFFEGLVTGKGYLSIARCKICRQPQFEYKLNESLVFQFPKDVVPVPIEIIERRSGELFAAAQQVKNYPPAAAGILRMCAEALIEEIAIDSLDQEALERWSKLRAFNDRIDMLAKSKRRNGTEGEVDEDLEKVISSRVRRSFHLLRWYGNAAVHGLNTIQTDDEKSDVDDLVTLIELVIEECIRVPKLIADLEGKRIVGNKKGEKND